MAFDQATRKRLNDFVNDARQLLSEEFTQQLQNTYGLDPVTGHIEELGNLPSLSPSEQQTAQLLRDTLDHYLAASHKANPYQSKALITAALDRIVREQAFTVLNRLAALRMAEARQFVMESISQSYQSKGFQLYQRIAGTALGDTGQTYQVYLFSVFDELSLDLAVLFDRFSAQGRLFPRETVLLELLDLINDHELEQLWAEDETVGWIYQYFNSAEERKQMRKASQAPRNSRELAVRNQFFTPRYVVEFLTDNTLGRIWYEMTKGQTTLADSCQYLVRRPNEIFLAAGEQSPEILPADEGKELSQEELLQQTVYIQHRPLKDPRDIKMLDPACGSMHFGLYAFDLFENIYSEAWDLEESNALGSFARDTINGEVRPALHQVYNNKQAFLADVPKLIIENNIHGVDIDPRAAQIAGLSLWLRAQKSWSENDIKPTDRPAIQRSNIVCAEPMPGEKTLLKEFTGQIQPKVLGQLVEDIFDKMQLAGEAGTLLKIEEEIQSVIKAAKKQSEGLEVQGGLFAEKHWEVKEGKQLYSTGDVGDDFWNEAEHRILSELERYAETVTKVGSSSQKRLFAADAAKGFAFIDLCRKKFDAILMNPPFDDASKSSRKYVDTFYANSKGALDLAFIERATTICNKSGIIGALASRTLIHLRTLAPWRESLLEKNTINGLLDIGYGEFEDVVVQPIALSITNGYYKRTGDYISLLKSKDKEGSFRSLYSGDASSAKLSNLSQDVFKKLPGSIFGHWLDSSVFHCFSDFSRFENEDRAVRQGLATADDFRFLRMWWECEKKLIKGDCEGLGYTWARFSKGGDYAPFFNNMPYVVKWQNNGYELKNFYKKSGKLASRPQNTQYYFKEGITYSECTTSDISLRPLPKGTIFGHVGLGVIFEDLEDIWPCLALMHSRAYRILIEVLVGSGDSSVPVGAVNHYTAYILNSIPFNSVSSVEKTQLISTAKSIYHKSSKLRNPGEIGNYYQHLVYKIDSSSVGDIVKEQYHCQLKMILELLVEFSKLDALSIKIWGMTSIPLDEACGPLPTSYPEKEIDKKYLFGLLDMNPTVLTKHAVDKVGAGRHIVKQSWYADRQIELICHICKAHPKSIVSTILDSGYVPQNMTSAFLQDIMSKLFGMVVGRYDLPIDVHGAIDFDPIDTMPQWPIAICEVGSKTNAIIDEHILERDIFPALKSLVASTSSEKLSDFEADIWSKLNIGSKKYKSIYDWYSKEFFSQHLAKYSEGRRQAPIYWQIGCQSGSYTIWLYFNALNDQTLFSCVNNFVDVKIEAINSELSLLDDNDENKAYLLDTKSQLADFRDELLSISHFWQPRLEDGVIITAAPLWKLFQHKPWQKKLKKTWEELEQGKYDWSHMAYNIWPERVLRKCHEDRSIAIAHGVEDDLWEEVEVSAPRGKTKLVWQPKDFSEAELSAYIQQKIAKG